MTDPPAPHSPDIADSPLTTEAGNRTSAAIDTMSAREIVGLMNREDATISAAVEKESTAIAAAIDLTADRLRRGGRLIYVGAGTSGRLGVLDASECPPTFSTDPGMVVGLIAGGPPAFLKAVEGAEDSRQLAVDDLTALKLKPDDVVFGIASSGRTPYVLAAIEHANSLGAASVGLTCNSPSAMDGLPQILICPIVGPEIITGSTRLKAGTATKMVLNMVSTGTMVLLGKTYGNLMVDLTATNEKLADRTQRIVRQLTGLSADEVIPLLDHADGELKTAVVMHRFGCPPEEARNRLARHGQHLRGALQEDA